MKTVCSVTQRNGEHQNPTFASLNNRYNIRIYIYILIIFSFLPSILRQVPEL